MPKFRKKPVVIEAVQYDGNNALDVVRFIDEGKEKGYEEAILKGIKEEGFKIRTLEGKMKADVGDWIIKGVKGEFYPCKPDIFEATYELAE